MAKLHAKNVPHASPAKTGKILPTINPTPKAPGTVTPIQGTLPVWTDADHKATVVDADKKTVTCTFATKSDKNGTARKFVTVFDYAECTMAELLERAVSTDRIDMQRRYREAAGQPNVNDAARWNRVNVAAEIRAERAKATKDPVASARNAFAKLDDATKEMLRKEFAAQK